MLTTYVNGFAESVGLTKRETEILGLLTQNCTHLKDIAEKLSLSQSTVNNHLNNIYVKAKVKGKAQLLAKCFEYIEQNISQPKKKFQPPKVLIVDDEEDLCMVLDEYLKDIGFEVDFLTDPTQVMSFLHNKQVDIILSDISMPNMDGFELLKEVRSKYKDYPVFMFMTGYTSNRDNLKNSGASIIIDKPIDFDLLYYQMMQFYIEDMTENGRMLRVKKSLRCLVNNEVETNIENISLGGLFLNVPDNEINNTLFQVGQKLSVKFQISLAHPELNVECEIIWKRDKAECDDPAGVGITFENLGEQDRLQIEKFIYTQKILDLIPIEQNKTL